MNETQNIGEQQNIDAAQEAPKVMQQHEITALVTGEKKKAYEKGRQDAKAELMAELQAQNNTNTQSQPVTAPVSNEERLRQIALEELSKQRAVEEAKWRQQQQEAQGMKILEDLKAKTEAARSKFEDYDKVVNKDFSDFAETPAVLAIAHQFDNAGEMLYDLAKNPVKCLNISLMLEKGMKAKALAEMKRLSDSIKLNEMSAQQPQPKPPLQQINPSIIGVGKTDGKVSSKDFIGQY